MKTNHSLYYYISWSIFYVYEYPYYPISCLFYSCPDYQLSCPVWVGASFVTGNNLMIATLQNRNARESCVSHCLLAPSKKKCCSTFQAHPHLILFVFASLYFDVLFICFLMLSKIYFFHFLLITTTSSYICQYTSLIINIFNYF